MNRFRIDRGEQHVISPGMTEAMRYFESDKAFCKKYAVDKAARMAKAGKS